MIAGELENSFNNYDLFIFGKKDKEGKPKVSFGEGLKKLGQKIDNAGGIEGIGRTVDNVRSLFKKSDPATAPPSDFEIGLRKENAVPQNQQEIDKKKEEEDKEKKLIITGVVILTGVVIVGGLLWWFTSRSNQNQVIQ
jgi:hypothetical protein